MADGDIGGIAADRLKHFIERVERVREEIAGLNNDVKDIYGEAKSTGFDVKIMKRMIRLRAMDKDDRREERELEELYASAIGMEL